MSEKIKGLTEEEVEYSRREHGENILKRERTKGFFGKFFENLSDPIIRILMLALILEVVFSFGSCNWFEVCGILLAILIATTVTTVSEHMSEAAFARMQAENSEGLVRVIRDGIPKEIPTAELVVGDAVLLSRGEKIPADGVLIEGKLSVDQSALNGESREVQKHPGNGGAGFELSDSTKVYQGSIVCDGEGVFVCRRVGAATYYGLVARDVQTETRTSPLKLRLARLASVISKIGYILAGFVAFAYLFNTFVADQGFVLSKIAAAFSDPSFVGKTLLHALTLMITVIVVAVPEGLPMMITVVLSSNMKRMQKDGVLVKKLVGIETAGSMNMLFTDKTGTLTTGKLEIDRIVSPSGSYRTKKALKENPVLCSVLRLTAFHNTESKITSGGILGGNGTDRAIGAWFVGETAPALRILGKIPFSSERKFSAVTLSGKNQFTLVKGAPEEILRKSKYSLSKDGALLPFSREEMETEFHKSAGKGERVIAIMLESDEVDGCIFVCLAILKDKLRSDVKTTVKRLAEAGIQIVMLTGDSKDTARAIAEECGILKNAQRHVLDSSELAALSDEEVKRLLPELAVLARALPQDKCRLVRLSQEENLVVGMTGDGINDAPSLKLADVGFAMGAGADIAKDSGDVVILDNSLSSISNTVLYGRTIFASIRKFITFQLIMNFVACGVSLIGQFIGIDNPITVMQMLWVNLIMDTLGGLAFAGEAPLPSYMKEKPKRRDEPILTGNMLRRILISGSYTLFVCLAFLKGGYFSSHFRASEGNLCHMSAFYALFIFIGIANSFMARSDRLSLFSGLRKNKTFLFIMAFISLVQLLMIYFGGTLFRTMPLLPSELLTVILISLSVIPFEFLRRFFTKLVR